MNSKDKELIMKAHSSTWEDALEMESKAESEEAKCRIRNIVTRKFRKEEMACL